MISKGWHLVAFCAGPKRAVYHWAQMRCWFPLTLVLALLSCTAEEMPRQRIDEQLLAALGMAQSYQHQADELVELDQRAEAILRVQKVLEIRFPGDAPEGEDVRLDAHGRIAELQLELGELDLAEAAVARGLTESTRTSYFQARLFNVQGRVLRARAARLREAGRVEESRPVSRAAIQAFERSIAINREVLGVNENAETARTKQEER